MVTRGPALRVGNCSGFYGDRLAAMREMLDGGPLDVLTGDYLAELTMLILFRAIDEGPDQGLRHHVPAPARGLPGAGRRTWRAHRGQRRRARIPQAARTRCEHSPNGSASPSQSPRWRARCPAQTLGELDPTPVTVDPYLGCWGIVDALSAGATVVVTGRTTDAALVCGPAAWHHGWARDDWDALAGAVVAGHVLECGAQATGGNYAFFAEVPGLDRVGFPLAEIAADGSSVITKHPDTGGLVSVGTVTAQLLYEIDGPAYLGPDVVARFDTIELTQDGPDRVRVAGVRGAPPPATVKVSTNSLGGFRNSVSFVLCGLDIPAKAQVAKAAMAPVLGGVRDVHWELVRLDQPDAPSEEQASALLRCHVKDGDPNRIGRPFSAAAVEMALASYPGFTLTSPPADATPYGVYRPVFVDAAVVTHTVTRPDGSLVRIVATPAEPHAGTPAAAPGSSGSPAPPRGPGPGHRCPIPGHHRPCANGSRRRRPFRGQGRHGQSRGLGANRRGLCLAGRLPDRRAARRPAARGSRAARVPLRDAQSAGAELHAGRAARRGGRGLDPVRSAGQGAGRVAALAPRRRPNGTAATRLRWAPRQRRRAARRGQHGQRRPGLAADPGQAHRLPDQTRPDHRTRRAVEQCLSVGWAGNGPDRNEVSSSGDECCGERPKNVKCAPPASDYKPPGLRFDSIA